MQIIAEKNIFCKRKNRPLLLSKEFKIKIRQTAILNAIQKRNPRLFNRVSALSNSPSNCNDFFANCCNCCKKCIPCPDSIAHGSGTEPLCVTGDLGPFILTAAGGGVWTGGMPSGCGSLTLVCTGNNSYTGYAYFGAQCYVVLTINSVSLNPFSISVTANVPEKGAQGFPCNCSQVGGKTYNFTIRCC